MEMGQEGESVNSGEALCDVIVWERDIHLSLMLLSKSGTTCIAYFLTGVTLLLTLLTVSLSWQLLKE